MPQHTEQRTLPYTPAQLFALVADIERYPEFLPWCIAARVRAQNKQEVTADLIIGYKAFREKFTSVVTLQEPESIVVRYESGPLAHLSNAWRFAPNAAGGCDLVFHVDFGFRSSLLGAMMDAFFDKAFRKMVAAFETRAKALYG